MVRRAVGLSSRRRRASIDYLLGFCLCHRHHHLYTKFPPLVFGSLRLSVYCLVRSIYLIRCRFSSSSSSSSPALRLLLLRVCVGQICLLSLSPRLRAFIRFRSRSRRRLKVYRRTHPSSPRQYLLAGYAASGRRWQRQFALLEGMSSRARCLILS